VSFAAITLSVASRRVFIVVRVYFVIDSVRNLLVTPPYEVLTVAMIHVVVFWVVTPCGCFGGPSCLHFHLEDGATTPEDLDLKDGFPPTKILQAGTRRSWLPSFFQNTATLSCVRLSLPLGKGMDKIRSRV
jgi:hypothetical protein